MKLKKLLCVVLSVLMVFSTMFTVTNAEDTLAYDEVGIDDDVIIIENETEDAEDAEESEFSQTRGYASEDEAIVSSEEEVIETLYVAEIDGAYYASVADAIAAAEDGDTIVLIDDIADLDLTISKNITLDLGDNTITDAYIITSGNVTIQNGYIKNTNEPYPVKVTRNTLTIDTVEIEASNSDRAIWVDGGTLEFNSGSVLATKGEGNTKPKIYGIWVSTGTTANIYDGSITVDAGPDATAVAIFGNYVNTVNVYGGKISTSGKNYSYAIWTDGDITVSGGEIITNEKQYGYSSGITYGNNYAITGKCDVEITGGTITTNGYNGNLVNAGGSNQNITISGVEFNNVLTDVDKEKGGHKAPELIKGSSVIAEISGGQFNGVADINPDYVADGATISVDGEEYTKTENGLEQVTPVDPTGDASIAYIKNDRIYGEATGNASESWVMKILDADGEVMGTTSLNNIGGIIDGDVTVTWNLLVDADSNTDEYWTMEWTTAPTADNMPASVELWIDGVAVDTGVVKLNRPDDSYPVIAALTDDNGVIESFVCANGYTNNMKDVVASLTSPMTENANVVLMRDITLTEKLNISNSVNLDGNGHTISAANDFSADCAVYVYGGNVSVNNATFSGFDTTHGVLRIQNATASVSDCVFTDNTATLGSFAVVSYNHASGSVTGCTFTENTGKVIDLNYNNDDTDVDETLTVVDCTFTDNTCNGVGMIEGYKSALNIENGTFSRNTADSTMIFTATNGNITGNIFNDNNYTAEKTASVIAGPWIDGHYDIAINGNAFQDTAKGVWVEQFAAYPDAVTIYNLDSNYWNGGEPDYGTTGEVTVTLDDYYLTYENGVLGELTNVAIAGLQGAGTEEDPFLINNIDELVWFRDSVNTYTSDGSNQYKNKYVKLNADIDLDGIKWTPIGANSVGDHMAFLGTFDGGGHTISNLYINADGDHLGFFARIGSYAEDVTPTVKNITFNNVDVSSNTTTSHGGSYVGGVIANAGGNSVVSDVNVTGDVYVVGYGYVGGIVGHGYPDLTDCHVTANDGSYLNCYYWCGGGIIGYAGEGGTPIINCSVSGIDIWSAYGGAAAVAGLLQDGNKLENVSATNVEVTSASDYCMGYIAGNGEASTMTNITATNVTVAANGEKITSTDAVASLSGTIYFDLQTAIDEANGATVTLLRDATENITIADGATVVIDLGGKTLNGYIAPCKPASLTISNGSIKNSDSSKSAIEINAGTLAMTNVNIDSARHAVRIDGAVTATINGGTYRSAIGEGTGTYHAINIGSADQGEETVTIKNGTFVGPKGTSSDSGAAVNVQIGATVTIENGNFSGGKNNTLAAAGTLTVYGGTFDQDPTAYVADGFKAVNKNGTWTVKEHVVLSGSGTATDPYIISNLKELKAFRDYVNEGNTYADQYIKLTDDINLTGEVWIPIGTSNYDKTPTDANVKMFAGNFDGNNHTITGLSSNGYIPDSAETSSTEYSFGLFGYVYGANISNVKLANVAIDCGTRTDSADNEVCGSGIAALIGYYVPANEKTTVISNCHVLSGTVKASNNMGGLIGHMDSQLSQPAVDITIENCSNAADVTTEAREAGGILGLMNSAREGNYYVTMRGTVTFKNCVNTGDITSLGGGEPSAGGILGRDHNQAAGQRLKIVFDGCKNSGTITVTANGETHAGGIGAGYYSNGAWLIAKDCENTGNVVVNNPGSDVYAGGLISYGGVVELINSTSTGTVTGGIGNTYVGGAQNILFLEKMDNFTDTVNGYTYYLNGGTSPEYAALVDDAAGGGNFHLVETAYKDGCEFGGWYDNTELTGEAYTALNKNVKTYYAKWIGDDPVAKIGDNTFASLQDAIKAAQDGDKIVVLENIDLANTEMQLLDGSYDTYFLVEGKNVTIDLNGKTISGAYTGSMLVGVFSTDKNGHLTLTGNGTVDVTATGKVYSLLVAYNDGSGMTVENGTYTLDKASDNLIYYGGYTDAVVTVKDGTFTLGNVGEGENGKPWIFNVLGAGDHHVLITGGTFNADVNRQHWSNEAVVAETCYTVNNGDGTWTVKDGAEAYVETGMTTGPYFVRKNIGYATIKEAIEAAVKYNDPNVTILAGNYTTDIAVNGTITVAGETDKDGNNLVNITGRVSVSSGATVKNLNVHNEKTGDYDCALVVNGKDIALDGVKLTGYNAMRYCYANGDITIKNSTINGSNFAVHFDGTTGGNIAFENCDITGWCSYAASFGAVSYANCSIDQGNYSGHRYYNKNVSFTECDFAEGFQIDLKASGSNVAITDADMTVAEAKAMFKDPYYVANSNVTLNNEKLTYVASAYTANGSKYFDSLQDAINEVNDGGYITVRSDIVLTDSVTIPAGKRVTIGLGDFNITGTDNATGNFGLININPGADLTIDGNGKITLTATNNRGWNNYSSVISNQRGKLTIDGVTIEHLGGTDMAYGIDNLTNGKGTYAETIIEDGTVKSTYRAIRQFLNGTEAQNILTVNGGTIEGANKSIWAQNANANNNPGKLTVNAEAVLNGDVLISGSGIAGEWSAEVSIAAAALSEGSAVTLNNAPAYVLLETNGVYGLVENPASGKAAQIDDEYFETLAEAIAAAEANDTIVLLANIEETVTISKNLTIDGADKNYAGKITVSGDASVTVQNVNFVKGEIVQNGTNTTATLTVKDCTFANGSYAVTTERIAKLVIEDCTVTGQSLLYAKLTTSDIVVKNVIVDNGNYVAHLVYGSTALFENVTLTNGTGYGICTQNYGAKTITLKNCNFDANDKYYALAVRDDRTTAADTFIFEGENSMDSLYVSQYAKYVLAAADATLTAPENDNVTTNVENSMVKYVEGTYKVVKAVAKIGDDKLFETFADVLDAVQNEETITLLNVEGSEINKEIEFTKNIEFTITGTAPEYALPIVTFQNATVNIKDAEILIPELDARQNATINVINSIVHDAGGNSIVKSYYNGAINISGTSVVYAMQVTTMGYITVSDTATLTATWQTNVYGNGMITVKDSATFNTAALHLTGKEYSGRDNTDDDRVGKPAQITVDGATLIVGKALSDNGADYSYNSSKGINIGTITGKKAVLDIVNGAKVNIYMANGETANIGADGTVNVNGTLTVGCRAANGTATLVNNGSIILKTVDSTVTANECGNVTTDVAGYEVKYADGKYALTKIELFKLSGSNVKINSSLTMFFYIPKAELQGGVNYYATITKASADEEATELTVPMSEWEVYAEDNNLYRVAFDDLMAYMMNDEIKVQIFNEDGVAVSEIWTDSISYYAHRTYNNPSTDDLLKTALVDMLNYGAACQIEFGYDADNLANKNLTPEQQDMASGEPTLTDSRLKGDRYFGSSLTCDSTLVLQFYFTDINDTMTAKITYIDAYEDEITMQIDGAEFNKRSSDLTGVMVGLPAYDAQQLVKCEVYDGDTLVASASDSIESYVARMTATGEIYSTIMKFALSSKAALLPS